MMLLAAMAAGPAFAVDSGDIVVASLRGEVHVTIKGQPRAVRAGTVLELPASVRTGRDGAIELRQGATSVRVGPETLLDFPAQEKRGAPIDVIQQPRGSAFYDIGKRQGRKLRVETPYLVGVVKGTQFSVAAHDESTTISLFEGLLEIRAADDSAVVDLKAGEIASRRRGEKSIDVVKMDVARAPPTAARSAVSAEGGEVGNTGAFNGTGVDTGSDVRTPLPVTADSPATAGADSLSSNVATNPNASDAVETAASAGPGAGTTGVDAAASVASGVGAAVDLAASTAADLGTSGAAVAVSTSGVSVDLTTSPVDAGPVSTDVDTGITVDVNPRGSSIELGTPAGLEAGPVSVNVGSSTSVDLDTSGAAASVDAAAALGVGETPVDLPVNVSTGADLSTGTDLGLDGSDPDTDTDSSPTDTATDTGNTGTTDLGGLLDGLLRRPGRR